jgi:2-dehydropantoate 2-reductase
MAEHVAPARIAVVGAGAIGGWLAARLALAGHDAAVLVRAGQAGVYSGGITLVDGGNRATALLRASDSPAELGARDIVIFAVKAFDLADAAAAAKPLIGPGTLILPLVNGVPFWFTDEPLDTVDPGGRIASALPHGQLIGGVIHASTRRSGPSEIHVQKVDKLILGEPVGGANARVERLAAMFAGSAIPATAEADVRRAVWYKAWGNMTINPLSALTLATADRLVTECRGFLLSAMEEARAIGEAIGCPIPESGEDRLAVTARLGVFKTSMLQDVEGGRRIELEALLGAPLELARRHCVEAPNLANLYAMTRLMAEGRGLL